MDTWKALRTALVVSILLACVAIVRADAQGPQPIVSFEADKYQVGPNETVTLTWNMKNIEEASLIWPGGTPETLYGPGSKAVIFPGPGDYSFTLRALYPGGEKQIWIIFHVKQLPPPPPPPVCTPPPCPSGGVLRCPEGQQCPGGCGVVCVRSTRTWRVRGTVTDSIVGAMVGGASVSCQGGTVSASTEVRDDGSFDLTWDAPATAPPDGACSAQFGGFNAAEAALVQPGGDGVYQVQLALKPAIPPGNGEWALNYVGDRKYPELGRALGGSQSVTICSRKFERGAMLWRSGGPQGAIAALLTPTGRFDLVDDTWDQQSPPACPPPNRPGLFLPDRGLGWAWCQNPGIRDGLGYSTEPQEVCDGSQFAKMRDYPGGRLLWVPSWSKIVYLRWLGNVWHEYDFSP